MFAYLFIILAVICFAGQFAFTKLYEMSLRQTFISALVMLVVTNLTGFVMFFVVAGFQIRFSTVSLGLALMLALIMIPYYVLGLKALAIGSLAIYSMFMMLGGMLLPFFYGILILHETLTVGKTVGTVLLTVCIVLQAVLPANGKTKENGGRNRLLFFVLCVLIFLINGMTAVIAKAHEISAGAVDEASFTALTCAITAVLSLGMLLLPTKEHKMAAVRASLARKPFMVMIALGAAAYTGNFLYLIAAETVPASVQFPLVSGGVIVLSALVSAFIYKEKLSVQEWVCVGGSFLATFLFAF